MQDKTRVTIQAYDNNAIEFTQKFMDLSSYKKSYEKYLQYIHNDDAILDLGCGPGNVSAFLMNHNTSLKITGIDLSTKMIELSRLHVPQSVFLVEDIRNIRECINSEFDHIIASFCLPYLYNDEAQKFIKNCSNILRPGGYMLLSTMMGDGYQYEIPSFSKGDKMFFNYYSKEFLKECFSENSLAVLNYEVQDYYNKDGSILKDMIFFLQKQNDSMVK